ncbi:MAG: WD40 repeat domain-containing protein [Planctomycetia bacterium]|nr:WD40 repeat domain-containing protein [Planctomycetia bacterium]
MPDLFVRENPLATSKKQKSDAPVLLNYEDFGFPDEQVVPGWTVVGCFLSVITFSGIFIGSVLLLAVLWMFVVEITTPGPTEEKVATSAPVVEPVRHRDVFTLSNHQNLVRSMAVTPDGLYLLTGGGSFGRKAGRLNLNNVRDLTNEASQENAQAGSEQDRRRRRSVEMELTPEEIGESENYAEEDLLYPKETQRVPPGTKPRGSNSNVPTVQSSEETPAAVYITDLNKVPIAYTDYIHLGKNGVRILADKKMVEEMEREMAHRRSLRIDPGVLVADHGSGAVNPDDLPAVDALPKDFMTDTEKPEAWEERIWYERRPAHETYPLAIWSLKSCKPLAVMWEHEYPIVSIVPGPDGKEFLSADEGGYLLYWKLVEVEKQGMISQYGKEYDWKIVNRFTPELRNRQKMGTIRSISCVRYTPSGKQFILCGTADALDERGGTIGECGALVLWDIATWKEVLRTRPASARMDSWFQTYYPVGKYTDITFSPNGKYLIAGAAGYNSGVYWFETSGQGRCMANLRKQRKRATNKRYMDPSALIKSNLIAGVSEHEYPDAGHVCVAISPDGKRVVSGDNLGRLVFWNFTPNFLSKDRGIFCIKWVPAEEAVTRDVRSIMYSRNGQFIFINGDEIILYNGGSRLLEFLGTLRITDVIDTTVQTPFNILSWLCTEDEKYLAAGCDDNYIRIWRMDELPVAMRYRGKGEKVEEDGKTEESAPEGEVPTVDEEMKSLEESLGGVMKFDDSIRKKDNPMEKIDARRPGELSDPLNNRGNRSLESHNPLDKRLRDRGTSD